MIEVKTKEGQILELEAGAKLALQYVSPFFTDSLGNAEYSLPIKLVGSGKNKIALDFFDRIKSSNRSVSFNGVTVKDDGMKIAQDLNLYIDSVVGNLNSGNATFEGQLIGAKDVFLRWLGSDENGGATKKLSDVGLLQQMIARPSVSAASFASPNAVSRWATDVVLNPSTTPHICFPSYHVPNWNTYGEFAATPSLNMHLTLNGVINAWDNANNRMHSEILSGTDLYINEVVPMFKVYWVIEQILADAGYTIGNAPILNDADFKKIYVFNNVSITPFDTTNGNYEYDGFFVAPSNHMPDKLVSDWLNEISIIFGLKFYFKPDNSVDIFQYNELLNISDNDDWTNKVDANFMKTGTGADLIGLTLGYGGYDSENLLGDALKKVESIYTAIDNGTYTIVANKAALGSYSAGTVIFVKSENTFYQSQPDSSNQLIGDNLQRIKVLDGKKSILSNTITHNNIINPNYGVTAWQPVSDCSMSRIKVKVISYTITVPVPVPGTFYRSYYQGVAIQPFVSAIGIYHGFQTVMAGTFPFGSSNNYAPDSTTQLNAWHLGWVGSEGLYETFWKKWAEFLVKMITVKFPMYLNANDLATLDYSKKKRINGVNYYLKSLKVEFPLSGGKQEGEFVLAEGIDL